jgi:hypothetical protein
MELEKDIIRISKYRKDWLTNNKERLMRLFEMIENHEPHEITQEEKVLLSEYFDIRYYEGKIAAYMYVKDNK